jgi:periplasmic divalent cation tolerance protein
MKLEILAIFPPVLSYWQRHFPPSIIAKLLGIGYGFAMKILFSPILVLCSFPDENTARHVGTLLIERKLAACVTFATASSLYRWQGVIESATETVAQIKTSAAHFPALQGCILAHHPYEVPEIIGIPIGEISPSYRDWWLASLSENPQ